MIQDIAPLRLCNEFQNVRPADDDLVFDLDENGLLLASDALRPPSVREWRAQKEAATLAYAFRLADDAPTSGEPSASCAAPRLDRDIRCFLALRAAGESGRTPESLRRVAPSALRGEPGPLPFAAATAQHLARWYDEHRFCGRCGSALRRSDTERALLCPACGLVNWPVIAPCVIVAVTHGDRILLTRYARPGATRLVLVAGFVEIGETAEQAAAREVMEETGLRIKNLRYAGSQPWGFSGSLAAGFVADLDGPESIRLDTSELAEARWVKRADIPPCPDDSSLTMTMITRFARGEL